MRLIVFGGRRASVQCARVSTALAFALSSAVPVTAAAAPAEPDLAAVDQGFRRGQVEFNRGEYLTAARTWVEAAALLPETPEHRENRAAIYEYIADAYTRGTGEKDGALVLEALNVLDSYADAFSKAYPGQELPPAIVSAQVHLRNRAAVLQAARTEGEGIKRPPPPPSRTQEQPPPKPWKGLVIGGGVALGASVGMLALFGASLRGVNYYETEFNRMENGCNPNDLVGQCEEYFDKGTSRDRAAVVGLVAAPVFLAAGTALLVLGLRRKLGRQSVTPALGGGVAGVTWRVRF
jgi:hypothetical protein